MDVSWAKSGGLGTYVELSCDYPFRRAHDLPSGAQGGGQIPPYSFDVSLLHGLMRAFTGILALTYGRLPPPPTSKEGE